jgi:hypothetical protein
MDEAKYAAKADEAATKGVCDPAVLPTEAIRTRADREGGDPARCAEGAAGKDRSRHSSQVMRAAMLERLRLGPLTFWRIGEF